MADRKYELTIIVKEDKTVSIGSQGKDLSIIEIIGALQFHICELIDRSKQPTVNLDKKGERDGKQTIIPG